MTSGRRLVAGIAAALVLGGTASAPAHPHVYVDYSIVLPLGPEGIEAIGFVFTFDEQFSAMIRQLAAGGDPAAASQRHARILAQLPHEIDVAYNGAPVALETPTDVEVAGDDGRITYRFRVPLGAPLRPPGTLEISVDDQGYYTAFARSARAPVEVRGSGATTATCGPAPAPSGAPGPLRCVYAPAP